MGALDTIVRSGRALYIGISSYNSEQTLEASRILKALGTPCLIHQPRYNMFDRRIEDWGLLDVLGDEGIGCISFSPLDQGVLTNKYIGEIPGDSRAAKHEWGDRLAQDKLSKVSKLNVIARERGANMAQLAIAWNLRHPEMTSALIGASKPEQIDDAVAALDNLDLSAEELKRIEAILNDD